jgi:hypothetical protein
MPLFFTTLRQGDQIGRIFAFGRLSVMGQTIPNIKKLLFHIKSYTCRINFHEKNCWASFLGGFFSQNHLVALLSCFN